MTDTAAEVESLLSAHGGEPVDYVAIVTLLNTVAGGHYEERNSEAAIRKALLELLRSGRVSMVSAPGSPIPTIEDAAAGHSGCNFRLAD